jgi:peptidoglycan/LPS O-acetylase OafA/YrhL
VTAVFPHSTGGRPRDAELDGLRGIAIALVLVGHLLTFNLGTAWSLSLGALGVQLFFALSGFLITRLLVVELDETGRIDLKRFYIRRAFRIFPAFYVFLAVIAFLMVRGHVIDTNWKSFTAAALYVSNIRGSSISLGHTWSLALEEQFYALWPITLGLMPRARRSSITLALILSFVVWRGVAITAHLWPYDSSVFYERTDFRLDSLLIGGLLALRDRHPSGTIFRVGKLGLAVSTLVFLVSPALNEIPVLRPVALSVSTVAAAAVLKGVLDCSGSSFTAILRQPVLRGLGRISYSVYLWQQPLLVSPLVAMPLEDAPFARLLTCLVLSVASFTFVEQPMLRLRDAYGSRLVNRLGRLAR